MKSIRILLLYSFILVQITTSCKSRDEKLFLEEQIIEQTITKLVPSYPDIFPIEFAFSESKIESDKRFEETKRHKKGLIDSLGVEIWVNDELVPHFDQKSMLSFIQKQKGFEHTDSTSLMRKKWNPNKINQPASMRIVPKKQAGDKPIQTIGFATYSPMAFNKDKSQAIFHFIFHGRSCTDGYSQTILVMKKKNKWTIIKPSLKNIKSYLYQ